MTAKIRVRFAPSPTGMLHVGSARSALFNWVYARQHGGVFVLRIEDTDAARNRPEWTDGIIAALDWLGIGPGHEGAGDGGFEGPLLQSDNTADHAAAADRLHAAGTAYYCDCTREDILARTGRPHRGYDGHCRDRDLASGSGRALRFRTPDDGATVVRDLVRGTPTFQNSTIDDFVIVRADGSVLFLLANVVDDVLQGITHVIRAEEHLPNAPKQQLLWEALGQQPPVWAHVPVIVNDKRQKLSKRRDKVALESYRAEGYLPGAMRNYLMLLGWAPANDREIVPWQVMEDEFHLEAVNPSPAFFDERKLRAFNGDYMRALSTLDFIDACQPWVTGEGVPWPAASFDAEAFAALAPLAQTRLVVLSEITALVDFAFLDQPVDDEASWAKAMISPAAVVLPAAIAAYDEAPWRADELKGRLVGIGAEHGLSLGKAQAPVRVAVTGRTVGLPLFESLEVLGRERTMARLRAAAARVGAG